MSPHQDGINEHEPLSLSSWQVSCVDVDRAPAHAGFVRTFVASASERSAIAAALGVLICREATATLTIHARAGGRYVVSGRLQAVIEQACVVTLEPVLQKIDEPIAGEFCPASDIAAGEHAEFDIDSEDEPIAIVDGQLDVGQLAFETLALAIDPFPRAAGVEEVNLERGPSGRTTSGQGAAENPFAVLAKLKRSNDE